MPDVRLLPQPGAAHPASSARVGWEEAGVSLATGQSKTCSPLSYRMTLFSNNSNSESSTAPTLAVPWPLGFTYIVSFNHHTPIRQMLLLSLFPNEEAKARKGKALPEAQPAVTEGGGGRAEGGGGRSEQPCRLAPGSRILC